MRSTVFAGVDGVQRREHEVAGLGGCQRDFDRLAIAHLADENHLRRLAQRSAQRQGERRRVAVQLALMNRRLLVRVQELDRILDREDVIRAGLVDQIDDRRERRRLARSGRPGDEHDAVLQRHDVGQHRRQIEIGERRDPRRDHAHDDRVAAALTEDVDAKARPLGSEYERSQAPCSLSARSAIGLLPMMSRARRAVSGTRSTGSS